MYATPQDMVDRFGEEEIRQLVDRACEQANPSLSDILSNTLLWAKMDDACAEMNVILSCCYDIKRIKDFLDEDPDNQFPILKHWQCDITRKHLYDCLEGGDHQVDREYRDYEREIRDLCKCSALLDQNFCEFPKNKRGFFLVEDDSCVPPPPCCSCKGKCCCGLDTGGGTFR